MLFTEQVLCSLNSPVNYNIHKPSITVSHSNTLLLEDDGHIGLADVSEEHGLRSVG